MSNAQPIRSPSYPNMSLSDAIGHVRKIEGQYRQSPVDREIAAKILGYSSLSGPANKSLAALAQYGLVERAGKGEMRVTQRARAILHPNDDGEYRSELRAAALEPQLFRELQERWPNMMPPEDGIVSYLNRKGFNQTAIRPAAKAYLRTLLFLEEAGASESHGLEQPEEDDAGTPDGDGIKITYGGARVGDWVDYESGGAIANPEPLRVRAVSEDGTWVFVDGTETGLEMDQVIVVDPPEGATAKPKGERPTLPLPKQDEDGKTAPGMRKAMFPLAEGDVTLIFPEGLSPSGLEDLNDYLAVFLKQEARKRRADNTAKVLQEIESEGPA